MLCCMQVDQYQSGADQADWLRDLRTSADVITPQKGLPLYNATSIRSWLSCNFLIFKYYAANKIAQYQSERYKLIEL